MVGDSDAGGEEEERERKEEARGVRKTKDERQDKERLRSAVRQ